MPGNIEYNALKEKIFTDHGPEGFRHLALDIFRFQYASNAVYRRFCDLMQRNPARVSSFDEIPFLPIGFFRTHPIVSSDKPLAEMLAFTSSGTTDTIPSVHYIPDPDIYLKSLSAGFRHFYGDPAKYAILALLPSYLEKPGSSLVYMAEALIMQSGGNCGGFFLSDFESLASAIRKASQSNRIPFVLGVSYALLDFVDAIGTPLPEAIIVETGGMKGRRKEMVKSELHQVLSAKSGVASVHSEYGMTELCSQAWSDGKGVFRCPPWMKVEVAEINDPMALAGPGKTGVIRVTDLANLGSCAFVETQDLGRVSGDGFFEVMGRMDHSMLRGCNLMVG
ncbi:MAG TPA: acyltransferase [Bacteroidales bacterium]|nr:acyltransferase [Bacteroidales bacterium]HRZ50006.1 acyltransferase [Bacteroidales bacterium]